MATRIAALLTVAVGSLALQPAASAAVPDWALEQAWYPKAPPLPAPAGDVVKVATVGQLYEAATMAKPGGTILVADGTYMMPKTWYVKTDNVTLRSESGDRTKVVIDFANSRHGEGLAISGCMGVTIADLTVRNVTQNGIKINSNLNVSHVTIYNVVSHNVWQRHIKGPKVPDKNGEPQWVEGCKVQYCLFYNDRPKQRGDDPYEDSHSGFGFNYVGGMDIMNAKDWVISDNVFTGIRGKTREGRGAIFMWHNSRDVVIERNLILDCDTGIALGNSSGRGERRHATNFLVRNNFVVRCPESAILADHTRDCTIVNNTVLDPDSRMRRLIRVIHANDGLIVKNNIFSGPGVSIEGYEGKITFENNLVEQVSHYFIDPAKGNLRLKPAAERAIGKAVPLKEVTEDIDGQPRGAKPDLGANELAQQ